MKQVDFDRGMKFAFTDLDTTFSVSPLQMKDRTVENSIFFRDKWDISPKLVLHGEAGRPITLSMIQFILTHGSVKVSLRQDLSLKLLLAGTTSSLPLPMRRMKLGAVDFGWAFLDRPATFADQRS
ncbi:MAG: hypothetical protein Ct9H300mP9_1630 [Candidatus Neomarinimicrobiota bacterium]|nr:MAG: hypothetical protein Ct9H300mP9_1630 [Candidatus Neomarinimicrobiota bacterium]